MVMEEVHGIVKGSSDVKSGQDNVVSTQFQGIEIDLCGTQVVENMDKTLNRFIVFIGGLSFKLSNKGWLLQNQCIKNVTLTTRKGSWEDSVETLAVEGSWVRGGRVG